MLSILRSLIFMTSVLLLPVQLFSSSDGSTPDTAEPVKAEIVQEEDTILAGRPFWVAVHLDLQESWHVYWKNPGDAGMPLKIQWDLPEGFTAGSLQWPFPEKFTVAEMVGFGYKGEVVLLSQIFPPDQLDSAKDIVLQAQINWLVCSPMTCQPGSASVSLPLKPSTHLPKPQAGSLALFERARSKIPQSHVEFKTVRKSGVVQLEVDPAASDQEPGEIQEAFFFPEQKDVIDHTIDPTVDQSGTEENRYFVNLKGCDEIGAERKSLKGVLVLHQREGGKDHVRAFDIDSPIEEDGEELISYLDSPHAETSFTIGSSATDSSATNSASAFQFQGGFALAFAFAFLGGMILNLMPCVLPVMSFKVMSFVKMSGQSRSLTLKHGIMFSVGVLLSFWVLATVMLVLRAYGQAVGWGFQLQEPLFVVILASLLFIFALNLFGLFEWGTFFASWAGQTQAEKAQQTSGYTGSFLNGVLATAVATPCTGPFLGSAVGFAVTLPAWQSLLIFSSLGLGMSFPYLLLAAFPSFLRFMPKPGAWMEIFKQLMGFLLLATVLWLMWVFSAQTNAFSLICLLAGFLCFAIGAWIYGRGCTPVTPKKKQVFALAFVVLFVFAGVKAILLPHAAWDGEGSSSISSTAGNEWAGWEDFSPERLDQLRLEGKPVLIDFTAKWCLICQANHLVLASDKVKTQLDQAGVVKMRADWTRSDPVITEHLSRYGRNSVPLYLLFGPNGSEEPFILPQVLTADIVTDHLKMALHSEDIALK